MYRLFLIFSAASLLAANAAAQDRQERFQQSLQRTDDVFQMDGGDIGAFDGTELRGNKAGPVQVGASLGDLTPRRPGDGAYDGSMDDGGYGESPDSIEEERGARAVYIGDITSEASPISREEMALQRANAQPHPNWQKGFIVRKLPDPVCEEVGPGDLRDAARSELEEKVVYGATAGVAIYMSLAPLAGLFACGAGMLIGAAKS